MRHWVCLSRCIQKNSDGHRHQRIVKLHQLRLGVVGVDLARCTNLQKPPHCPKQEQSHLWINSIHILQLFKQLGGICTFVCKKNLAQKIISPIGAPRISHLGTLDFFIRGEYELRSPKPNNSHFPALIKDKVEDPAPE